MAGRVTTAVTRPAVALDDRINSASNTGDAWSRPAVLIGAGGHARSVVDALYASGLTIGSYADRQSSHWLVAELVEEDAIAPGNPLVLGFAGVDPSQLRRRLGLLDSFHARGHVLPPLVDPRAILACDVQIEAGAQILAGAIVRPGARLERGCILNTGAIVEHDCRIGAGTHVGPRATVLADTEIGACCMIGAGAVVLAQQRVGDDTLIRATERHPR